MKKLILALFIGILFTSMFGCELFGPKTIMVPVIDFQSESKSIDAGDEDRGQFYFFAPVLTGFSETTVELDTTTPVEILGTAGNSNISEADNGDIQFEADFEDNGFANTYVSIDGTFTYHQKLAFTTPGVEYGFFMEMFPKSGEYVREIEITGTNSEDAFHATGESMQYAYGEAYGDPNFAIFKSEIEVFKNTDILGVLVKKFIWDGLDYNTYEGLDINKTYGYEDLDISSLNLWEFYDKGNSLLITNFYTLYVYEVTSGNITYYAFADGAYLSNSSDYPEGSPLTFEMLPDYLLTNYRWEIF